MEFISVADIREEFTRLLNFQKFTSVNREASMSDLVGNTTIEITGASFVVTEPSIFGTVNDAWVAREEEWYNSQSLNVNDIPGGAPAVWKAVADKDGFINSNYGWAIYADANTTLNGMHHDYYFGYIPKEGESASDYSQYNLALKELKKNPESRRAMMIYTRPSMWLDYNKDGRSDFMCTNTVQYLIRDGRLDAIVQMRSNDAVFGFKNDNAWQQHVLKKLAGDLNIPAGLITWQVGSLHVYARHYYLVDYFMRTGSMDITPEAFREFDPYSPYNKAK
jgi:thymidylate synthase